MSDIGIFSLQLGLLISVASILLVFLGARQGRRDLIQSGENAALTVFGLTTIAVFALEYLMLTRDFNVEYVAQYTSRSLSTLYTVTALWGGQAGSLLFWVWLLSGYAAVAILINRTRHRRFMPWVVGVTMTVSVFFHIMLIYAADPFLRLDFMPADGNGLNPLLQNPGMAIHPVTLYLGYVGFTIPFAFAIAALATRQLGVDWIRSIRRWTIVAWFFLTLGNILGAKWAYVELGWGGYWAWDPVENAAIMPWFTGSAFLHSIMIQEKKGMLKIWNMVLIILTFLLTIFGTFLTRSGILSSVHSFATSSIGPMFAVFLAFTFILSALLLLSRLDSLRSENQLESFVSRESTFLFNNLLLVGMAFSVFWGTIFPLISEAVRGVKITVSAPFFNQINVPIGLAVLLLTGVCSMISWRKMTLANFRNNLLLPTIISAIGAAVLYVLGIRGFYALSALTFSLFTFITIFMEFWRGTSARMRMAGEPLVQAFSVLVGRNKRRYGGYIIHLGIVLVFIGITGSSAFQFEERMYMKAGETVQVKDYELQFSGLNSEKRPGYEAVIGKLIVSKGGEFVTHMNPEKRFYEREEQPNTEVEIYSTLKEDLYIILAGWDDGGATFNAFVNPLIIWIWIGGGVMTFGTLIAVAPDGSMRRITGRRRRREKETYA